MTLQKPRRVLLRGSLMQLLRLGAGLVLLAFVVTHFLNHAAGLLGVEAMERVQTLRFAVTRSSVGTTLLASAFLVHISLGLARLAERRTLRMPLWEALQLTSGLLIPLLLLEHIVGTHVANALFGTADFYRPVLSVLWPDNAASQSVLVLLVWLHACIGIHYWLRLADWYGRVRPLLAAIAVLLPALALAGFFVGGREQAAELASPAARDAMLAEHRWPIIAQRAELRTVWLWSLGLFVAALTAALALPVARMIRQRRLPRVTVTYVGGPTVTGPKGATLLEISRLRGVPHASVCGGRARCSTCRVRIESGREALPPPSLAEAVTLGAVGAPEGVRLACQIRPREPLTVTRLVDPGTTARFRLGQSLEDDAAGMERHLAVMFLDIKGFTAFAERRLAYDVVFLLNRFYFAIGAVIVGEGGWIDKYMGDGLLAVFGRETGLREGARAALAAARRIDLALDALNAQLVAEGLMPLGVGIGLHAGSMVVGKIGYAETAAVTVIGATVNTASRLEGQTRERDCQLVVSRAAARAAGWRADGFATARVAVKGVTESVEVILVARAREITLDDAPT
ncbi:MAG: adenylate/guanylate cyclase domain-containing protein [Hyphomicrobiaceae bacterium]|nr:adenylate/guanylate cyclase domain-containing protein [Hyphomicrobiaceae bacterium]